ncbi:MAG: peptidoglycan-binding protein [Coriobacteriia bacterium]|nr:peptidoglycan-binding protein [Coriobacteriia bacterium]
MKPILPGGRGAAVEDVQRRLLQLGYDLGPTGVDGVFFGHTRDAVIAFQREHELSEDGIVGPETWSTLVDSTFTLGDRMLYLRLPYFHGHDVRALQEALNSLGFSCGDADGIFGSYTERAVREFQRNSGQPGDGIVGPETVRSIQHLRHVWQGKSARSPETARVAPARISEVLTRHCVAFIARGGAAEDVASRTVNLALATDSAARVMLATDAAHPDADVVLDILSGESTHEAGPPTVSLTTADTGDLAGRVAVALAVSRDESPRVARIVLPGLGADEHERQRIAVLLLDAVCLALD